MNLKVRSLLLWLEKLYVRIAPGVKSIESPDLYENSSPPPLPTTKASEFEVDRTMTLDRFVIQCYTTAKQKGFWEKDRSIGEMLMLIVSELGEAIEAHRAGKRGLKQKDTFEDELADTFIRLADMCGGLGIDIVTQIQWKMQYNKNRGHKHGKLY